MDIPAKILPLAQKIKECEESCNKTYGYCRVHIWLEINGIYCIPKTILRVMQKYNLLSVIRRKKYRNYGIRLHKYPNLLNRYFHADSPNQKWVTDISYIYTKQGVLYLSAIMALYDNSIVAYKTESSQFKSFYFMNEFLFCFFKPKGKYLLVTAKYKKLTRFEKL